LTDLLSGPLRAPVVDQTGLTGRYDFAIDLMPYITLDANGESSPAGIEDDLPAMLSAALQEQLGLRLEVRESPIAMVVVDYAERAPVEN